MAQRRNRVLMLAALMLGLLAARLPAQQAGINLVQVNYRIGETERRLKLAEQKLSLAESNVARLTQQVSHLEARFGQLLVLLDGQHRETKQALDDLKKRTPPLIEPPAVQGPVPVKP